MIALIRKESHLALEALRPIALIALGAAMIAPLVGLLPLERWTLRSISSSEALAIVGMSMVMGMPLVALWLSAAMTVGDERHGGALLAALLPVSRARQLAIKLGVMAAAVGIFAVAVPLIIMFGANLVSSLEPYGLPALSSRELRMTPAFSVWFGAVGLLAGWGASGLGRPVGVAVIVGLTGAALAALGSALLGWWALDFRFEVAWDAWSSLVIASIGAAIVALFTSGTISRLVESRMATVCATTFLAIAVLGTGPVVAELVYMRPARAKGRLAYGPEEERSIDFLLLHVDEPERGMAHGAAGLALLRKVSSLTPAQRLQGFESSLETILAAMTHTPDVTLAYRRASALFPYADTAPAEPAPELLSRLIAIVGREPPMAESDPEYFKAALGARLLADRIAASEESVKALDRLAASKVDADTRHFFEELANRARRRLMMGPGSAPPP